MAKGFYIKKNPINTPPYADVTDVALSALSSLLINGFLYYLKDEKKYLTMNRPGLLSTPFCDLGDYPVDGLWWWSSQKVLLAVSNGLVYKIDQTGTATQLTGVTLTKGLTNFAEVGVGGKCAFMASGGALVYTDDLVTLKNPQGLGVPTAATHVTYMDDRVIANEKDTATFRWTDPGVYTADVVEGTDGNNYLCINSHVAVSMSNVSMNFINGTFDPTGLQISSLDGTAVAIVSSVKLESGAFVYGTAKGTLYLSTWNGINFLVGAGTFLYRSNSSGYTMTFTNGSYDPTGLQIQNLNKSSVAVVGSVTLTSGSFAGGDAAGTFNLTSWNGNPFFTGTNYVYRSVPIIWSTTDKNSYVSISGDGIGLTVFSQSSSHWGGIRGTVGVSSGKYYWEVKLYGGTDIDIGIATVAADLNNQIGNDVYGWSYASTDGYKIHNGTAGAYGAAYTTDDVIGIALNMDAGTLTFYKNGVSQGVAFTGITGTVFPAISVITSGGAATLGQANFGATAFKYSVPVGFTSLNPAVKIATATADPISSVTILDQIAEATTNPISVNSNQPITGNAWASYWQLTSEDAYAPNQTMWTMSFSYGVISPTIGSVIHSADMTATAIISSIVIDSGSWVGGDAAGTFYVTDWNGVTFPINTSGSMGDGLFELLSSPVKNVWVEGSSYSAGWQGLSFANMEAKGETLQALDARFDTIILVGKKSIEYWVNDGSSPFSKYEGLTSETGTIAPDSVIFDGNMHWMIDNDRNFVQLINRAPKVVSNPFASLMQKMGTIEDAFSIAVKCDGRNFIVITFPTSNLTIVYDAENDMWQGQWGLWNTTTAEFDQWIPRCSCKCPEWGFDLVGDRRSGKIYKISRQYATDAESILRVVKRTGMIDYGIRYQKRSERLRITIQRGTGLPTGIEPVFTMKSKIDDQSWTAEKQGSLGKIGDVYSIVEFRQNGIFRYRQDEYVFADAVPLVLVEAEEEFTVLSR